MKSDKILLIFLLTNILSLIVVLVLFAEIEKQKADLDKSYADNSKLNQDFNDYKHDCLFYIKQQNKRK